MRDNLITRGALESLVLGDSDFRNLESLIDYYCPFRAMGVVHAEIRHSHFLSHLLDPAVNHGFGSAFLRAFLSEIAATIQPPSFDRLSVHLADIDDVDVLREDDRMDLVLVLHREKIVVVIELKVNASEGDGQLERYEAKAKEKWPQSDGWRHLFIFLTPDGRDPSHSSWKALDYGALTSAAAHVLSTSSERTSLAREMLTAYTMMLKREHMQDENLEELARRLWQRHADALRFLMAREPNPSGGFIQFMTSNIDRFLEKVNNSQEPTIVKAGVGQTYLTFGIKELNLTLNNINADIPSSRLVYIQLDVKAGIARLRLLLEQVQTRSGTFSIPWDGNTDQKQKTIEKRVFKSVEDIELDEYLFDNVVQFMRTFLQEAVSQHLSRLNEALREYRRR